MLFIFSTSQAADIIQENEKGELNAHLDKVKLSDVTKFINKKYGIEFKGKDTLFQTPITVSFTNLKLEQMLKKILSQTNYVLAYDGQGNVTEVTLLATGTNNAASEKNTNIVKDKQHILATESFSDGSQDENSKVDDITTFKVDRTASPPGNEQAKDNTQVPEDITSFKAVPNSPPPGNNQANGKGRSPEDITSFKVMPNTPPPGK